MKIESWAKMSEQMSWIGGHHWAVSRLIQLSKDFKVTEVPLDCINVRYGYNDLNLRQMVMHMNAVNDADLKFPIILDEDGELMDGRHRIMKAMMMGKKTIKVVRFDINPKPCKIDD